MRLSHERLIEKHNDQSRHEFAHEIPEWVRELVLRLSSALNLNQFRLSTHMVDNLVQRVSGSDDQPLDGNIEVEIKYLQATLKLDPRSREDTAYNRELVAHEICHMLFARTRRVIDFALPLIENEKTRDLVGKLYSEAEEEEVEHLSRALIVLLDASDGETEQHEHAEEVHRIVHRTTGNTEPLA